VSEQNTEQTDTQQDGTSPEDGPTFDAAYVKKLRDEAARYRTEAKANADAAKRLAEIEEANQTEAEKQAKRLAALEQEAQSARADALRFKVAAEFGVTGEDADLFLTGTDEETLTRQAKRLTERADQQRKSGNHVPREGATQSEPKEDEMREFARNLFQKAEQ
jgi:hypothetical protein